jgi:hypothetical protein
LEHDLVPARDPERVRADGSGARAPVSRDGGAHPLWVPGRNEIVFQHGPDRGLVLVPYRVERGAFVVGAPRPWPGARVAPFEPSYTIRNFDLSPDGERLLVLGPPEPAPPPSRVGATLFLNFFDELKRRTGR